MKDLYFIRARLRRDASGSEGALVRLVADTGLDPASTHHLVWTLFGDDPDRRRDFVFRIDRRDGRPEVMAYADRPPVDGHLWEVWAKPFAPSLSAGDRLRFSVRVNPVIQRGRRRIDAIYDAILRARSETEREGGGDPDAGNRAAVIATQGAAWFAERASRLGFELEEPVEAVGYQTRILRKSLDSADMPFRLSTIEISGHARVVDPEAVHEALAGGVGRAKAYGCGMLLIARA